MDIGRKIVLWGCSLCIFTYRLKATNNENIRNVSENVNEVNYSYNYSKINKENFDYICGCLLDNISIKVDDLLMRNKLIKLIAEENRKKKKKRDQKKLKEWNLKLVEINKKLNLQNLLNAIFSIYIRSKSHDEFINNKSSSVLTVNELKAFSICDNKNTGKSLVNTLFKPKTITGEFKLNEKIINPGEDMAKTVDDLRNIQHLDIDTLNKLYDKLAKYEDAFISLFSDKKAYERFNMGDEQYNAYIDTRSDKIKKTSILNWKFARLFLNLSVLGIVVFNIILPFGVSGIVAANEKDANFGDLVKMMFKSVYGIFGFKVFDLRGVLGSVSICKFFSKAKGEDWFGIMRIIPSIMNLLSLGFEAHNIFKYFKPTGFYENLTEKYHAIKMYYSTMKDIFNFIKEKDEDIYNILGPKLSHCANMFGEREGLSNDQIRLLNLLDKFPEKWSYWKNWGKARARKFCTLLYLFDNNKDIFINPIIEIAELETYLCVLNLIRDPRYKGRICFPTVVKNLNKPYIVADDCWNPFLPPTVAVGNDIRLGRDVKGEYVAIENGDKEYNENGNSVILLYGMNAGGKTTAIGALAISCIFVKSFGISFSRVATISDIGRLFSLIDVTTDISKGYSRYMSEVAMCDQMISFIEYAKKNNINVVVFVDELFAGTNHDAAGKLGSNVLKYVADSPCACGVFAGHNDMLLQVESNSNGAVKNMRMEVEILEDGTVKNKYKIKKGALNESIAENIIKNMACAKNQISKKSGEIMLGRQL